MTTGSIFDDSDRALLIELLRLEIGFDDDDESKHQFAHLCWPYAAYEGALCGSDRLWFHGGPATAELLRIDCVVCIERIAQIQHENEQLLHIIGRLAEAVDTLSAVKEAASGRVDAVSRTPEYLAAVKHGYRETSLGDLRTALAADLARHAKNATEFAARKAKR